MRRAAMVAACLSAFVKHCVPFSTSHKLSTVGQAWDPRFLEVEAGGPSSDTQWLKGSLEHMRLCLKNVGAVRKSRAKKKNIYRDRNAMVHICKVMWDVSLSFLLRYQGNHLRRVIGFGWRRSGLEGEHHSKNLKAGLTDTGKTALTESLSSSGGLRHCWEGCGHLPSSAVQ